MISLIVKLLISFPEIAKIFFQIQDAYIKEAKSRRFNANDERIDEWLRDDEGKQD